VGIRFDFCVPMRDRYRLAYGPDEKVLLQLAPADREQVNRRFNQPARSPSMQVSLVEEIASQIENDLISVSYSPTNIQWCSTKRALLPAKSRASRSERPRLLEESPRNAGFRAVASVDVNLIAENHLDRLWHLADDPQLGFAPRRRGRPGLLIVAIERKAHSQNSSCGGRLLHDGGDLCPAHAPHARKERPLVRVGPQFVINEDTVAVLPWFAL
jgi:hypothetical protein